MKLLGFLVLIAAILFVVFKGKKFFDKRDKDEHADTTVAVNPVEEASSRDITAELWRRKVDKYLNNRFRGELISWRYADNTLYRKACVNVPFTVYLELVNGKNVKMAVNPSEVQLGYKPVILPKIKGRKKTEVNLAKEWLLENSALIDNKIKKELKKGNSTLEWKIKPVIIDGELYELKIEDMDKIKENLSSNTEYEVTRIKDILLIDFSILSVENPE